MATITKLEALDNDVIGTIGFSAPVSGGNFFQVCIKLFTGEKWWKKAKWTHAFFVGFPEDSNIPSVIESSYSVQKVPLDHYRTDNTCKYVLYKFVGADPQKVHDAIRTCYVDYSGDVYGYVSLLWFVWRWLLEIIGIDIHKNHNFSHSGKICSKLQMEYGDRATSTYKSLLKSEGYNPSNVAPQDIQTVIAKHPELFKPIEWQNV